MINRRNFLTRLLPAAGAAGVLTHAVPRAELPVLAHPECPSGVRGEYRGYALTWTLWRLDPAGYVGHWYGHPAALDHPHNQRTYPWIYFSGSSPDLASHLPAKEAAWRNLLIAIDRVYESPVRYDAVTAVGPV
jgi:hypothetical protein